MRGGPLPGDGEVMERSRVPVVPAGHRPRGRGDRHPCTKGPAMFTASRDCRIIGDLLEGHALNVLDPGETSAVRAHLAACAECRDEHHCLAAVAAHLSCLRRALADGPGRARASSPSGAAGCGRGSRHRRRRHGAARGAPAASLTLSQWVSRLACVR
ncbi:zf-HC2 domain-containing protein (plasmid) [Streptomyces sp. GDS52]|uniref:zf-HC2 domain-containing protein n=1 Tax=Streptomyces sp. GDS52 TaxID=3406419 RepID=UPI003FD49FC4